MAGVWEEECMGRSPGDEPLTLTMSVVGCHSYMKSVKGGISSVIEPTI